MTRLMTKRQFPGAIVSSTVGATLISIAAVCLATSPVFTPMVATPHAPRVEHEKQYNDSCRPPYRLSPIPAGADWTS
jgi:hypothetical protein